MKINKITAKRLYAYPEEVTLTFPEGEGLINVRGENGSGKTSILDTVTLCLFKDSPNRRGGLYAQFPKETRDGLLEVDFDMNGHNYVARRLVDVEQRKQKAFFYIDGHPVTEGLEKQFDEAVKKYFCSQEMFLSSIYSAQENEGNLLNCPESKQRELLAEMLGLGELEELYKKATEKFKAVTRYAEDLQLQANQLKGLLTDETAVKIELGRVLENIDALKLAMSELQLQLDQKKQELANAKANAQNIDALRQDINALFLEIGQGKAAIYDLEARIKKNQEFLLNRRAEIEAAVIEADEIQFKLPGGRLELEHLQNQLLVINSEHRKELESKSQEISAKREAVKALQEGIDNKLREIAENINLQSRRSAEIGGLQSSALLTSEVPCSNETGSTCKLLASAFNAQNRVKELEADLNLLREQELLIVIDKEPLEAASKELLELEKAYNERLSLDTASEIKPQLDESQKDISNLEKRLVELKPLLDLAPNLVGVDERVKDYQLQISQLAESLALKEERVVALQEKVEAASALTQTCERAMKDIRFTELLLTEKNSELSLLLGARVNKEGILRSNENIKSQLNSLSDSLTVALSEVDRWKLYKLAVSPKGIQALETDAAGPEISSICNEILAQTFGSRFSIKIETLRELVSGKKIKDEETGEMVTEQREKLLIKVIDNEKTVEGEIFNKSGGEKSILGEVLSLSIAIYNKLKQSLDYKTLIRDEVTAALSLENSQKYLHMLRTAQKIGHFDQVVYVSHHKELQGEADYTYHCENGRIMAV